MLKARVSDPVEDPMEEDPMEEDPMVSDPVEDPMEGCPHSLMITSDMASKAEKRFREGKASR